MRAPLDLTDIERDEGNSVRPEDSRVSPNTPDRASTRPWPVLFPSIRPFSFRRASIPDYRKSIIDSLLRTRSRKSSARASVPGARVLRDSTTRDSRRSFTFKYHRASRHTPVFATWTFKIRWVSLGFTLGSTRIHFGILQVFLRKKINFIPSHSHNFVRVTFSTKYFTYLIFNMLQY